MYKANHNDTTNSEQGSTIDLNANLPILFPLVVSGAGGGFQILNDVPGGALALHGIGNILGLGEANHLLSGDGDLTTITGGNGNNQIRLSRALNTIVLGDGSNFIDASSGHAFVRIGPGGLTLYLSQITVSLEALGPVPMGLDPATLGQTATSGNIGVGNGASGNIGVFNGLWNTGPNNGTSNIGAFNGLWNGGSGNGNFNIGVLNGDLNGIGNHGSGNGFTNGNNNTGFLNGNLNGNFNNGNGNGSVNGNQNFGALNGNLNGNRNGGDDNGRVNGNGNVGSVNGNLNGNGNGLASVPAGPTSHPVSWTFEGAMNTIVVGNGNNTINAGSGLCTVVAGNGNNFILIGGRYDTVVAGDGRNSVAGTIAYSAISLGNGGDCVSISGDYNRITAGSGSDTIHVAGDHNWIDAGGGMNFIGGGEGNDTFVLARAGNGQDFIADFSLSHGDILDLRTTLAGSGWNGKVADLTLVMKVVVQGNDTLISARTSPGGNFSQVADLSDMRTTLIDLVRHNSLLV